MIGGDSARRPNREDHSTIDVIFPVIFAIPVCGFCFLLGFGRLRAGEPALGGSCVTRAP